MAGANSRIDFFLKQEKIAIEAKATREALDDHQLGKELLEDLPRYKAHNGVKTLYFFIWDPDRHIRNAEGIANDVKHEAGERRVNVILSPPRQIKRYPRPRAANPVSSMILIRAPFAIISSALRCLVLFS